MTNSPSFFSSSRLFSLVSSLKITNLWPVSRPSHPIVEPLFIRGDPVRPMRSNPQNKSFPNLWPVSRPSHPIVEPLFIRGGPVRPMRSASLFTLLLFTLLFSLIATPHTIHAQEQEEEQPQENETLPPNADAASGVQIYRQRCANCHGSLGLGDGELAPNLPNPPPAIGSAAHLATADPQAMFQMIQNGNTLAGMPGFGANENSDPLSDEEIWDVVAGLYALEQFSQPIKEARVSGRIVNGTTGETLADTTATLQAFTPDFTPALQLETVTDSDGNYTFDLTNIPPDWFYRTVANHNGLDFTSDFAPLSPFITDIALPVTVYESTTSDAAVSVSQLEIIYTFGEELVQVAEFYTFDHATSAVYVGDTGDYTDGTVRIPLPENAQNVTIWRNTGGITDFVPMDEQTIVTSPTERRLAWPLSPGQGGLRLLVRYTFPYDRALSISHPLPYPTSNIEALLPANGVTLDGWIQQETTYSQTNDPSLTRVTFTPTADQPKDQLVTDLIGFPTLLLDSQGQLVPHRNEQQELIIGGLTLILVLILAFYLAYQWYTAPPAINDQDTLLHQLAALDLAYQQGEIGRAPYRRRRSQLKSQLLEIWHERT